MPTDHCAEQNHTICALLGSGLPYKLLDRRANWQHWTDKGFEAAPDDAILHWSGYKHADRLRKIQEWTERYPLPGQFTPPFPPGHRWALDLRHVRMIHDEACSGAYGRVLEIGCFQGYSSTALLAACKAAHVGEVHLCEPYPTAELEKVIAHYNIDKTRVYLHRCTSLELLQRDSGFDLVFIDGDHEEATVAEELRLLIAAGVRCIFAHDTADASHDLYQTPKGPRLVAPTLAAAGYVVTEDSEFREGERTERGLVKAILPPKQPEIGLRLSVIVASKGRPCIRTLESITSQLRHGDELIVQRDETGDMAATPRTRGMLQATGDWLLFMDDDDIYTEGALEVIRAAIRSNAEQPHLFGMEAGPGWKLPYARVVKVTNVSTQMFVCPNVKEKLGKWGPRRCGDYDFIESTLRHYPDGPVWHDEVIAVWRPGS